MTMIGDFALLAVALFGGAGILLALDGLRDCLHARAADIRAGTSIRLRIQAKGDSLEERIRTVRKMPDSWPPDDLD